MVDLVKNKLLAIARSGIFINFPPEKIDIVYKELKQTLLNGESIDVKEIFELYELHIYLSLITGHDVEARNYIDRIIDQFGDKNSERISILKSLYFECQGEKKTGAKLLSENKDELRLSRRLITYHRNDNPQEYIKNLNFYLNLQPADLITWGELAHEYTKIGHYDKAIFCLKEILMEEPVAYPIHYKVGLLNYYLYHQNYKDSTKKDVLIQLMNYLKDARNSWLRTIEVCHDHKLSWMGIYVICNLKSFNDKLSKLSVKEVDEYNNDIKKLLPVSRKKVMDLNGYSDEQVENLNLTI